MKLRVRFAKLGKVRWTSHRDVARMWERAFRRVSLPLAYSGGFAPRPKVSFGLALPTGYESVAEYLDIELAEGAAVDLTALPAGLTAALPAGVDVLAVQVLEDRADSLQQAVTCCTWVTEVVGIDADDAQRLVDAALAAPALVVTRERKGQQVTDDLRPAIRSFTVMGPTSAGMMLESELATQPRGVRPVELLDALDASLELGAVRRTYQWIERDGARDEPIPMPATDAPHVLGRAS
jgi:radical SAM-linked protein